MEPSSYYERIVAATEDLLQFTVPLRPYAVQRVDRYSERKEAAALIDPTIRLFDPDI